MTDIIKKGNINIENMIYEVRGVQIMLSADVVKLYQDQEYLNRLLEILN